MSTESNAQVDQISIRIAQLCYDISVDVNEEGLARTAAAAVFLQQPQFAQHAVLAKAGAA